MIGQGRGKLMGIRRQELEEELQLNSHQRRLGQELLVQIGRAHV